jgi:hypothetical protein
LLAAMYQEFYSFDFSYGIYFVLLTLNLHRQLDRFLIVVDPCATFHMLAEILVLAQLFSVTR